MYWVCKEAANLVATFVRLPAVRQVWGTRSRTHTHIFCNPVVQFMQS